MKILYVTTISNTVNSFFIPHVQSLMEQGNQVGLAFNIIQEVNAEILELGCKIHQVDFHRNPIHIGNYRAYKEIRKIILNEGYEMIHVHTPVASFVTRLACRKMRETHVLYTAHGFHFFKGAPKKNWLIYYPIEKVSAKWTDGIITMNNEDYDLAKKLKLRKKDSVYRVNGIGVDLNKFIPITKEMKMDLRKKYGYSDEDFILIYVGELSYRKHQDQLIKAISLLKGKIPNLKLLLVGNGSLLNKYKELAEQLKIESHVEFLGFRKDIQQLMGISDVAISTSRQEGLPVNIMEAMATGLPLIVTNCRGNRDLVRNNENGYVIEIDDVKECADAIEKLYHSEELRQNFSNQNRKKIEKYSLKNVLNEMKKIYKNETMTPVTKIGK
ncbi:glycosyltransferase family 4 protein [Heyndrickxia sporothermodurans]